MNTNLMEKEGITFVIPMYNAERHIKDVLEAIFSQGHCLPMEVIVVNDGSRDGSLEIAKGLKDKMDLKVIDQLNQGAVTATNNGFKAAKYDIICSIDSDVILHKDWLKEILEEFNDPTVGAVQGYYKTPEGISFWARMMGYDIEARYDAIKTKYVTQVCTGNTAYRKSAIDKVGPFDPQFRYGYDNDMSYRLQKAGYKLVFRKDALCDHYWKADLRGYIKQQYHSAYGRMQLVGKHTERITGDSVSGLRMMLQTPLTLLMMLFFIGGVFSPPLFMLAFVFFSILFLDRFAFASVVFGKHKDRAAVFMPFLHILRNMVWVYAFFRWIFRRR